MHGSFYTFHHTPSRTHEQTRTRWKKQQMPYRAFADLVVLGHLAFALSSVSFINRSGIVQEVLCPKVV